MPPGPRPRPRRLAALVPTRAWWLAWWLAGQLACGLATPAMATPQGDFEAFRRYAHANALPLPAAGDLLEGLGDDTAPTSITTRLCAAHVVALGEPRHGDPAPLALRDRLFRSLVAQCGTRAIVLETGFTEAARLDQWLQTGSGDLDEILHEGLTWGFDSYPQNRALLLWMRRYNQTHPRAPLHLYGMDIPGGDEKDGLSRTGIVLETIAAFVADHSIEGLAREVRLLQDLAPHFTLTQWRDVPAPHRAALGPALDRIAARLRAHGRDVSQTQPQARTWILQNIEVARRSAAMFASWPQACDDTPGIPPNAWKSAQIRDETMAANVLWVRQHVQQSGPVFVYAHAAHAMAAKVRGSIWDSYAKAPASMGLDLRERLGTGYVTIAISLGCGDAGSLDRALCKATQPGFWLAFAPAKAAHPSRRWMQTPQTMRANEADSLRFVPEQAFDMAIHLR